MARNKPFGCPRASVGNSVAFYNQAGRKCVTRWRGPAVALDIDEMGVTVKFQARTFRAAKYCVRKQMDSKDAGDGEGNPHEMEV